jgi:hypothetical protein
MKTVAIVLAFLLVTVASPAPAATPSPTAPVKHAPGITPPEGTLQGGDTIETAVVIPELPYYTTGTTAGYNHDYDEACPYTGSTSPDVVYAWTATFTGYVEIFTCESAYDTKLFVYEDEYTPGSPLACNDDSDDCPGPIYRSWITLMPVVAGHVYYVVVDGYGGDFGDYLLTMQEVIGPIPCTVDCPAGAFDEEEPDCYDGYEDETNGGCSMLAWSYPELNSFICGTSGNYNDNTYRDMDWFEVTLEEATTVNWCICAGYPAALWILDGREGCAGMYTMAFETAPPNTWICAALDLEPGRYWFITSTDGWLGIPCGSEYVAALFEEGYAPVEESSWGMIKATYRR